MRPGPFLMMIAVGFLGTAACTSVLRRRRVVVPPVETTVAHDRRDLL
ncbi:hypothetical protein ABTX77_39955 [Streptomyces sp. NPDC097704]